jgi:hypothetical protein
LIASQHRWRAGILNLIHWEAIRSANECSLGYYGGIIRVSADPKQQITKYGQSKSETSGPHRGLSLKQYIVNSSHDVLVLACFLLDMALFGSLLCLIIYGFESDNYLYLIDGIFCGVAAQIVGNVLWLLVK